MVGGLSTWWDLAVQAAGGGAQSKGTGLLGLFETPYKLSPLRSVDPLAQKPSSDIILTLNPQVGQGIGKL